MWNTRDKVLPLDPVDCSVETPVADAALCGRVAECRHFDSLPDAAEEGRLWGGIDELCSDWASSLNRLSSSRSFRGGMCGTRVDAAKPELAAKAVSV
ncbi:hypothetical protein TCAL_15211 [Tigriopus californicus]|uniref:Uncharacterized protein n=1 Tax=Tigriopus californicus TaxID=6832 RepID=A0A553NBM5_TIGCA|nr:hypothetical protein TCAL_15211 [Tigriopus californicus]